MSKSSSSASKTSSVVSTTNLSSSTSVSRSASTSSSSLVVSSYSSGSVASLSFSSPMATPPSSGKDPTWRAARDPSVDRSSQNRLVPANVLSFYYVERGAGTRSKLQTATLASGQKGVLLEDIAGIGTITCTEGSISIGFTEKATADAALIWPVGTLLYTLADGCNTADERGVYSVQQKQSAPLARRQSLEQILQFAVLRLNLLQTIASLIETIQQLLSSLNATPTPTLAPTLPPQVTTTPPSQRETTYDPWRDVDITTSWQQVTSTMTPTPQVGSPSPVPSALPIPETPPPVTCSTQEGGYFPPADSSCFRIIGHGVDVIEGQYLRQLGTNSPHFYGPIEQAGSFYIDANGNLFETYQGAVMALQGPGTGNWMRFMTPTNAASATKATCNKNPATGLLTCYQTDTDVLSVCSTMPDTRKYIPMFGTPSECFKPITMQYEDVRCPSHCVVNPNIDVSCVANAAPPSAQCFTLTGIGAPHVTGQYLSMQDGVSGATLGFPGYTPGIFFINDRGTVQVANKARNGAMMSIMADNINNPWLNFYDDQSMANFPYELASCLLSTGSLLRCNQASYNFWSTQPTLTGDERSAMPLWGRYNDDFIQVKLRYTKVNCPAPCSPQVATPTVATPTALAEPTTTVSPPEVQLAKVDDSCVASPASVSATCFTLTGHGPSHIEGKYLGLTEGQAEATLGWPGDTPSIFYLKAGIVGVASRVKNGFRMANMRANTGHPWLSFWDEQSMSTMDWDLATCSLNSGAFKFGSTLNCTLPNVPDNFWSTASSLTSDQRSTMPLWGNLDSGTQAIKLSYTVVKCPGPCAVSVSSSSPSLPQSPTATPESTPAFTVPTLSHIPKSPPPSKARTYTPTPTDLVQAPWAVTSTPRTSSTLVTSVSPSPPAPAVSFYTPCEFCEPAIFTPTPQPAVFVTPSRPPVGSPAALSTSSCVGCEPTVPATLSPSVETFRPLPPRPSSSSVAVATPAELPGEDPASTPPPQPAVFVTASRPPPGTPTTLSTRSSSSSSSSSSSRSSSSSTIATFRPLPSSP